MFSSSVLLNMEEKLLDKTIESRIDKELRVLVFDAQIYSLQYLCAVLHNCNYKVRTTMSSANALETLRANKHGFDIVVVDIDTANSNAFKLVETIGLEMDLPLIMITADGSKENLKNGLLHGAAGYIIKPFGVKQFKKTIRDTLSKTRDSQQSSNHQNRKPLQCSDARNKVEEHAFSSNRKRKRLVWTQELEAKFEKAVQILEKRCEGSKRSMVHPQRILDIMDVPGLTREHVASHLQKYRINKRKAEMNQQAFESEITNFCRELEVANCNADHHRLVVPNVNGVHSFSDMNSIFLAPKRGNTVMLSSDSLPDQKMLVYSCLDGPDQSQPPEIYYNYCLETNIQPHDLESEHVSGTTSRSPYFNGVDSEPSTPSINAAFYPSPNAFVATEANVASHSPFEVSSVPNLLYGITMDGSNNVQYPGSTVLAGNGETEPVWSSTTISPSGTSSLHNFELHNEVSEADKNQIENGLRGESFDWSSLLNDGLPLGGLH